LISLPVPGLEQGRDPLAERDQDLLFEPRPETVEVTPAFQHVVKVKELSIHG
jgi:hypothetical protein